MARFGLVSSDEEEVESSSTTSSRSPSPPPTKSLNASTRRTRTTSYESPSEEEEEEEEDEEDEDDEEMDGGRNTVTSRRTRSLSPSTSSDSSSSPHPTRRRRIMSSQPPSLPPAASTKNDPTPWPKTLGLQPKRVAVMQASFFHQTAPSVVLTKETTAKGTPRMNLDNTGDSRMMDSRKDPALTATASGSRTNDVPLMRSGYSASLPAPPLPVSSLNLYRSSTPLATSITLNREGHFVDAGLMLSRSLNIGWGPDGRIISLEKRDRKKGEHRDAKSNAGTDELKIGRLRYQQDPSSSIDPIPVLQLQLEHTIIDVDPDTQLPSAIPSRSLRFHHFTSLGSDSSAVSSSNGLTPAELESKRRAQEAESQLWTLGEALFDEIHDLYLNPHDNDPTVIDRIVEIRRRDRVERWLREVVKREVEEDLRSLAASASSSASSSKATTSGAERIFILLTGHQVARACESATTSNDLRLATLVAQAANGGAVDDEFRSDIYLQLVKWREYGVEEFVSAGLRKVYSLLCGEIEGKTTEGIIARGEIEAEKIHVMKGLDWKRAFGVHLWYGRGESGSSLETAVEQYEAATKEDRIVARPAPSYCVDSQTASAVVPASTNELPTDPLFHLLKLFTSPSHPLESFLLPTNFGSSSIDYRLPWTLYLLLSRVLRRRDFEDRWIPEDDQRMEITSMGAEAEGNSVRADMVTESYATQLEAEGNWTWAVFVLLHLELSERRVKAIRELLARNAYLIDDESFAFLIETLKLPAAWIYSAQAVTARYNKDLYLAFQLHLEAGEHSVAHEIVVRELAPEAILRQDVELLRRLLQDFDVRAVENWESGGQVFMEYAECVQGLQGPSSEIRRLEPIVAGLIHSVPRLVERGGKGMKLRMCIAEMQSQLLSFSSRLYPDSSVIKVAGSGLREADRNIWLQQANQTFLKTSMQNTLATLAA